MIWEISVAVAAAAFVVLVVYLVKTLKAAEHSLKTTTETLKDVQKTIDELGSDVRQVVRQANELTSDIQHKMKQIDPLMESVKHAGEVLSEVTLATKQVSAALASRIASRPLSVKRKAPASPAPATSVPSAQPLQAEGEQPVQEANRKPANWVKWVDVAADVWQKYRS
ncbi:DUF948 domain-containing protein [Paenibacillus sp. MB22_1]|uniref:DUF948 domain-containing protein n=1 Tax=unclassified Paenibacillus TaxID=185978 RepID=UPI0021A904E8|nr:DUF948 domain-containing protein [Paenibacillus sp. p3-SID1389]MCT2196576.1 DUF948 domain-containing protein [Paenibacillus sp. p3-SID1389]